MKLSAGQPEPALNRVKACGAVKSGKKQEAGLSKEPAGKKRKVNLAVKPVSDGEDCSDEEHTANQKNASDSDGDSDEEEDDSSDGFDDMEIIPTTPTNAVELPETVSYLQTPC